MSSARFLLIFFAATTVAFLGWVVSLIWAVEALDGTPAPRLVSLAYMALRLVAPIEWCCSRGAVFVVIVVGNAASSGMAAALLARWVAQRRKVR